MDIGFVLNYLVCPVVISWGLVTGKKNKKHTRLITVYCFKGMFYWYLAIVNVVHYLNQSWTDRYIIGFTVALAIIEGSSGMYDAMEESHKAVIEGVRKAMKEESDIKR